MGLVGCKVGLSALYKSGMVIRDKVLIDDLEVR